MTRGSKLICLLAITIFLSAPVARAGAITALLLDPSQTDAPGTTLAYFVTLSNPSVTDTIFLNGISSTASSPFLSVDTTPFDFNAPLSLAPGASSGSFELFDVTIAPGTPPGPYVGSLISLLGGPDDGAGTDFTDLADVNFDVIVTGSSPVPEPGSLYLLLTALAAGAGLRLRQRTR